jgi:transposase/predicted nucleic acid-binding Zn finger protein
MYQSGQGTYDVALKPDGDYCTCDDFALTAKPCKHIFAARIVRQRDRKGPEVPLDTDTIPKRKTYKQDWPSYNLAQTTEKHRFQVLLADLCRGIAQPERAKTGRLPILFSNAVFAVVFKVYSTLSSRRFACDLKDAQERGYVTQAIHFNSIINYLDSPDLTPVLHSLIAQTSLPLKVVETVFAPDSTGFSTSRFVRWYDEKYGTERSGRDWVKAHAICGVKTNIVTAVIIEDRDAGDCPMFRPLVEATAKNGFKVKEVPADKAYLSHENLAVVDGLGGVPFVPFKVNSVQGESGTLWERMFHYYQFRRDEFLGRYHQRSNAESTFSMVKASLSALFPEDDSQSGQGGTYDVALKPDGDYCTCDDFALTAKPCKHIFAARIVRQRDRKGPEVPLDTDTIPKRKTYKQDWPSYNLAQTTKKHRFQVLLADLCRGIAQPERAKTGRLPMLFSDAVFAVVFKVYSTLSSRRFACDLKDAQERGYPPSGSVQHASSIQLKPLHKNGPACTLTAILAVLFVQSRCPTDRAHKKGAAGPDRLGGGRLGGAVRPKGRQGPIPRAPRRLAVSPPPGAAPAIPGAGPRPGSPGFARSSARPCPGTAGPSRGGRGRRRPAPGTANLARARCRRPGASPGAAVASPA